ncbi:hypothetical protein FRC08_015188 [Ceratobasidium sp. 394]|nr:hypothetical protein FRC08_015188 [Ceratobasidium sp. 394]
MSPAAVIENSTNLPKKSGTAVETPCPESKVLISEADTDIKPGSFFRVLDSYVFFVNNHPADLDLDTFLTQNWQGVSLLGAVASLTGRGSMFAQCGWFTRMPWHWLHISNIQEIKVKSDSRFRAGEPRMWLKTPLGEYVMLLPHAGFAQLWGNTLKNLGNHVHCSPFQRLPRDAARPSWWGDQVVDEWPEPGSSPPSDRKRSRQHLCEDRTPKRKGLPSPLGNESPRPKVSQVAEFEFTTARRCNQHRAGLYS